ncbi:MAG: SIS domain-containing protein, partial [Planctomycetes bacterium]|nr:SIS domain-containing protein [Planctomycetota bacterium]
MSESRYLADIKAEPRELAALLDRLSRSPAREAIARGAERLRAAPLPLLAGMGSSFHGGHALQALFDAAGRPARNVDAGELLHFAALSPGATVLFLSRSGRSVEIVELLRKAGAAQATRIGVTNDRESPLARECDPVVLLEAPFDHNVSVTMYSGVALAAAVMVAQSLGTWRAEASIELQRALADAERRLPAWRTAIAASTFVTRDATTLLLARGPGMAAALEARQLWEEAAKHPATALSTGAFRHGPNEVVAPGCRVVLWLAAGERLRALDLALAEDLRRAGARVALVGADLPPGAADLPLELPPLPAAWQFLVELMPVRLVAEAVGRARGVDCDVFRHCPFV